MQASFVSALVVLAALGQRPYQNRGGTIQPDEVKYQQQTFKQWWGNDEVTKLDDLPAEGKVPDFRLPYSGHDYPDKAGGTVAVMSKYDQAFHGGRPLATEYERQDIGAHRGGRSSPSRPDAPQGRGLFARIFAGRSRTPGWYGHCNGWTAASIRHAEPQHSVVRNGVTFTPADIKGLLAEVYMYSESEFLGGVDPAINPGTLHLTLANWLGRGSHPVGMETAVGEVVINYPIYAYKTKINRLSPRQADVQMTISYAVNIGREQDKGPTDHHKTMFFHYVLDLDEAGSITGGRFAGDSAQIDMLWTPLQPAQGGQEKNKRGNPHLNIKEVLAIWRESVPEDLRNKWLNIDPTDEDRILTPDEKPAAIAAETATPAAPTAEATAASGTTTAASAATDTPAASAAPATTEAASPAAPVAPAPALPTPAPAASPE
jgi:Transglutaminase elicitor